MAVRLDVATQFCRSIAHEPSSRRVAESLPVEIALLSVGLLTPGLFRCLSRAADGQAKDASGHVTVVQHPSVLLTLPP
jgi:hypothetical protein